MAEKGSIKKNSLSSARAVSCACALTREVLDLSQDIALDKNKKHDIEVYVDRLIIKGDLGVLGTRVSDSVDLALKLGEGLLILEVHEGTKRTETLMSEKFACPDCQISYPAPEPRTFSFNSPMGACPKCDGLGTDPAAEAFDEDREGEEAEIPTFPHRRHPGKHALPRVPRREAQERKSPL